LHVYITRLDSFRFFRILLLSPSYHVNSVLRGMTYEAHEDAVYA
jgi:hypothetical protein